MKEKLIKIYENLFNRFGTQNWWPADTKEEIVIGAILTQNTTWSSVEKALLNLKNAGICSFEYIQKADMLTLKNLIKPAGFFNQKAEYLKNISEFFLEFGKFEGLSKHSTDVLRKKLLQIKGVGKETADSILLYVFERPVFIVDAYTKRLVERHNLLNSLNYDSIQKMFEENLEKNPEIFNEYHALIVRNAKEFCKKKPVCGNCPLKGV